MAGLSNVSQKGRRCQSQGRIAQDVGEWPRTRHGGIECSRIGCGCSKYQGGHTHGTEVQYQGLCTGERKGRERRKSKRGHHHEVVQD